MERPIGWWLKRLDELIDARFAACYADVGLDRRQWQVLNVLAPHPRPATEVAAALAPFWDDTGTDAVKTLERLAEQALTMRTQDGRWAMTAAGESKRSMASDAVEGIRARMSRRVVQRLQVTIDVLSQMAANLSEPTDQGS